MERYKVLSKLTLAVERLQIFIQLIQNIVGMVNNLRNSDFEGLNNE